MRAISSALGMCRLRGACVVPAALRGLQHRCQSTPAANTMMHEKPAGSERVSYEQVWNLWNEGNLFSLSVAQMQDFLQSVGVATDSSLKKAAVVRRVEEYLHTKDTAGASASSGLSQQQQSGGRQPVVGGYGTYAAQQSAVPPEMLLDLAQAGFYEGVANMAPKAFQLLCDGASPDAVITRLNTASFPGFPANTECYSFVASDADVALKARFSKVLQWCFMNMSNMQMDGELDISLGKLLVDASVAKMGTRNTNPAGAAGEVIVSAYALQQRLQLGHPYTWVGTVPETAIPIAESFLQSEGFAPLSTTPRLHYDATIKRANDALFLELDEQAKMTTLHSAWVNIQTVHQTHEKGPDVRVLLRSRPPVRQSDVETYRNCPIIELTNDDVQDVLPPENGQLVYLSENETRRFEKVNEQGIVVTVTETRRQPLIVLRDEEEDPRVEYNVSVTIPASVGGARAMDVRAVGLSLFELANRFAAAVEQPFTKAYGE